MLFNSLEFAIFFPIVTAIYFATPRRFQILFLLLASCAFYMAFIPVYIFILFVTIGIDYVAGIYLEDASPRYKKPLLWLSIISTCTVLFVFKYFNFVLGSFSASLSLFGFQVPYHALSIILPIGLSFHTFQSLSYVVEVYRGHQKAERNLITYATYVMFFPQLVAGPIERPQNLLHQFYETHTFDYAEVTEGLRRMAWGLFKKLVVADRLALYVNDVYGNPSSYNGLQLTIATIFFAYQIYCDFSGYSDIALGAARILGFRLMENFDTPYYSKSTGEFWRRWHISLSTWFRDYLYVPLGGSRVPKFRHFINLLITFAVSGLWHGASWTYVIWGALNGVYLIAGSLTKSLRNRFFASIGIGEENSIRHVIQWASTFCLTCIAWVIFRARDMHDVGYVMTHFFRGWNFHQISTTQFELKQMPVALMAIAALELGQTLGKRMRLPGSLGTLPTSARWALYAAFVMAVVMFGIYRKTQFIYFQF